MQKLRFGERKSGLASLRDRYILPFDIAKGEKNHPRKIACHPRLFGNRLPEIDG
jgi:hypothetical protein